MTHPRLITRDDLKTGRTKRLTPPMESRGVMMFASDPRRGRWITAELSRARLPQYSAATFTEVVTRMSDDSGQRPQILVVDFDALDAGDLFALQSLRERGWFGSIIALGKVPHELAESLSIDRTLRPPLYEDLLVDAVESLGIHDVTVPIPTIQG